MYISLYFIYMTYTLKKCEIVDKSGMNLPPEQANRPYEDPARSKWQETSVQRATVL